MTFAPSYLLRVAHRTTSLEGLNYEIPHIWDEQLCNLTNQFREKFWAHINPLGRNRMMMIDNTVVKICMVKDFAG